MAGTRRTPINRQAVQPLITPLALALFERARRARGRAEDCAIGESGLCTTRCDACRAWSDAHDALHRELGLRPWAWPCVPRCPFPPNSPEAQAWRPSADQRTLWEALDEARRRPALN
jgi:hypothetical protein